MRGGVSGDGKLRGNRQMVDRYNEAKGLKSDREAEEPESKTKLGERKQKRPRAWGGESGGHRDPSGHDEIRQVVADHGHAVSHTTHKTHQGYESITQHEDGHVHHAVHDSLAEAHEHGREAFGDDTEHMGDLDKDDAEVAGEAGRAEAAGGMGGSRIGYMS